MLPFSATSATNTLDTSSSAQSVGAAEAVLETVSSASTGFSTTLATLKPTLRGHLVMVLLNMRLTVSPMRPSLLPRLDCKRLLLRSKLLQVLLSKLLEDPLRKTGTLD